MSKFVVRAGSHLEPDPTDTTWQQEKRQRRERLYRQGDVFESNINRVKQHGDKFARVPDDTPITKRDVHISNPDEDLLIHPEDAPVQTATITVLTEEQMNKMSFADLKAHCDAVGIDIKSAG